jgi:hypothetical protein
VTAIAHLGSRRCDGGLLPEPRLAARLRADTALYQDCAASERLIRHYLARSRWVNDRIRRVAAHEASVGLEVRPDETVDAVVTRWVQRLWPV